MSEDLRIAVVSEGITDRVVIEAAVQSMLGTETFIMKLLQPEESVAFTGSGDAGPHGGGWKGVRTWCEQALRRSGGQIEGDPLFLTFDVLILHIDVGDILKATELKGQLGGEDPAFVRGMLLGWVGASESARPDRLVPCTPAMSTETWVMSMFFPDDAVMARLGWEKCRDPEGQLARQPVGSRFKKTFAHYEARKAEMTNAWPRVAGQLSQAKRFRDEFISSLP